MTDRTELEIVREMVNGYVLAQAGPQEYIKVDQGASTNHSPDTLNVWYSHRCSGGTFNYAFSLSFLKAQTVYLTHPNEQRKMVVKEFSIFEPEMRSLQEEIRKRYDVVRKEQGRNWVL